MSTVSASNPVSRAGAGVVGGLVGGAVLGILLQAMGLLSLFAKLVGRSSTAAAWSTQLAIAALAGAGFGVLVGRAVSRQLVSAGGVGLIYGGALGGLFVLIILPLIGDRGVFRFDDAALRGIGAYVLFGVVTGIIYALAGPRRRYYDDEEYPRRQTFSFSVARRNRKRKRSNDED
jgi:hypothetical protein